MINVTVWCDLNFSFVFSTGFFTLTQCVPQYVFVNESKTWAEAQRYCREKYTDLATIENSQQTVQLIDKVNDDSIDLAWIGLLDDLSTWKWTLEDSGFFKEGEKDFRNWFNSVPSINGDECVYMVKGIWKTAGCVNKIHHVCYDGELFH